MQFHQRLIERHLLSAIITYMMLALFLLTGIILAQQSARFSEIMFGGLTDLSLLTETGFDLIPSVLIFTIPLAMLFGTVIGLWRSFEIQIKRKGREDDSDQKYRKNDGTVPQPRGS